MLDKTHTSVEFVDNDTKRLAVSVRQLSWLLCWLQWHRLPCSVELVRLQVVSSAAKKRCRTHGRGNAVFNCTTVFINVDVASWMPTGSSLQRTASMSVCLSICSYLQACSVCWDLHKSIEISGGMRAEWLVSPDCDRKVVGSNSGVAKTDCQWRNL